MKMEKKMQCSSAAAATVLQIVVTMTMLAGVHVTAFRTGYPSCKAIRINNPNATSGDYTLTTSTGRTLPKVYCEMGLNGGGYTFLHPADISQLTNDEVQSIFTDKTSFLMRVRLTNGTQPYGVLKQHPDKSSEPLAVFLNCNPGYALPVNAHPGGHLGGGLDGNYLYFGFLPNIMRHQGASQGLEVNGIPLSWTSCDDNPANFFALFPNNAESVPTPYGDNRPTWPFYSSILSALRRNPSARVMSDDYFTFFEGHFGGCGLYTQSGVLQARYPLQDLAGNRNVFVISMAIGFR